MWGYGFVVLTLEQSPETDIPSAFSPRIGITEMHFRTNAAIWLAESRRQRILAKGTRGVLVRDNSIWLIRAFGDDVTGFLLRRAWRQVPDLPQNICTSPYSVSWGRLAAVCREFCYLIAITTIPTREALYPQSRGCFLSLIHI